MQNQKIYFKTIFKRKANGGINLWKERFFLNSMTKKKNEEKRGKEEGREINKTKQVPNFQVSFSFLVLSSK